MLARAFDRLVTALMWIAGAILIAMMMSILYEIVMRYFLNRPTRWVVDFNEFALYYIVFLSAAWSVSRGYFVRIDFAVDVLPATVRRTINAATCLVAAAIAFLLTWHGAELAWSAYERGAVFQRGFLVPRWPIMAVMPFGMFLVGLEFLRQFNRRMRGQADPAPPPA